MRILSCALLVVSSVLLSGCSEQDPDFIADVMFGEKDVGITVTSPNGGGLVKRGSLLTITWSAVPAFETIDILLVRGEGVAATVTVQYPDFRRFDFVIPQYLTDSYDYRIRIIGHRADFTVAAESEKFRIY
jgi:hypothetical protein